VHQLSHYVTQVDKVIIESQHWS